MEKEDLPYRPCVGVMLINRDGLVFVGQRLDQPGGEAWQMPQGGIDEGEEPLTAVLRELGEETGISSDKVSLIAQSVGELFYDLPSELLGKLWKGKWRGQRQRWFLYRFEGEDKDINIQTVHPEFAEWKWLEPAALPDVIVPFKKALYEQILAEFAQHLNG